MSCCVEGSLSLESARKACTRTIKEAVSTTTADGGNPVLVDALPSLGKSRTAATVAQAEWCTHDITILTHRVETRNQLAKWAKNADLAVGQLPRFDEDCPTAAGEHGETWKDRVLDWRRRGISPGRLHGDPQYSLPCEGACDYMDRWTAVREYPVLIGHPTHAHISEVTDDRLVIFDEDPGDAYRYDFDANAVHTITAEFLADADLAWPTDADRSIPRSKRDLTRLRETTPQDRLGDLVSDLRGKELYEAVECVGRTHGHGAARAIVLALLDPHRDQLGDQIERVQLPDGVAVYDAGQGTLSIRRPPDLSRTAGIIALDGTPVTRIWEGRLGLPERTILQHDRVLCTDCRQRYMTEVLGYDIHQTSTHVRPYSSGNAINLDKDLALLEAVTEEHDLEEVAVISSKSAIKRYEEQGAPMSETAHYNDIKGTNKFEGEEYPVGVVIGSPHPGDPEIRRLAALNGDPVEIESTLAKRGNDLSYGVSPREGEPANPYLAYFRELRVAQAIFRFGRSDGATVYVHTSALPEWLVTGPLESEDEIFARTRSAGEREVLDVLRQETEITARELTDRVEIAESTVYERLDDLEAAGLVERNEDTWPRMWRLIPEEHRGTQGIVVRDRWYINLPPVTPRQSSPADRTRL